MSLAAQFPILPSLRALLGEDAQDIESGLLDLLPVGVYICDRDGRVVDYNKAAAELWGRAPERSDPGVRFCGSHRLLSLRGETIPHDACPMRSEEHTSELQQLMRTSYAVFRLNNKRMVVGKAPKKNRLHTIP